MNFAKKLLFYFLFLGLVVSGPVFGQENIKTALQNVVDSLDQLSKIKTAPLRGGKIKDAEELKIRKAAFKNILDLAAAESNNLKNKLIDLEGLDEQFVELKDQYLKELGNHGNYYESVNVNLEKETALVKIKELATQFRDWRKIVYHPSLQKIINFLLIFEGRDVLQTAENRFNNVSADFKKVSGLEVIKNSPLANLLIEAGESLDKAKKLQSAAELVILKASDNDIQKLVEDEIEKIKEVYGYFIQMSDWVKKASKK